MMDRDNRGASYHFCLRKQNVDLPTGYYFGMTVRNMHLVYSSTLDNVSTLTFCLGCVSIPARRSRYHDIWDLATQSTSEVISRCSDLNFASVLLLTCFQQHPNRPMEAEKIKKGQKFEGLDETQKQVCTWLSLSHWEKRTLSEFSSIPDLV